MVRAIDRGRAAGHYEDSLRAIIHAFKYEGRRSLAKPLAALMRRQAGELLDDVDWIVPVPLHWRRERERGFNQASDLARALLADERFHCVAAAARRWRRGSRLSRTWSASRNSFAPPARRRPRLLHALRRMKHTTVQAALPAARRHKNVRDAFDLSREFAPALDGACVLIVDDVSTTGATIEACARVLKNAGVKEIRAITAARVVTRPSR